VRTKIFAHRGASYDFAEQSREAFLGAIDQGADGLECDVRLSAEGIPICWHDRDLSRLTNRNGFISRLKVEEFKQLQINDPLIAQRNESASIGTPITLEELIKIAIEFDRELLIETKHPTLTGGDVESTIARLLQEYPVKARILSFSFTAISRAMKLAPDSEHIQLIQHAPLIPLVQSKAIGVDIELVRKDRNLISQLVSSGKSVFLWTVNDLDEIEFCARSGASGIITDIPAQAKAHLGYA
jgi:glycerophosphoryl diester phosphodiesterase